MGLEFVVAVGGVYLDQVIIVDDVAIRPARCSALVLVLLMRAETVTLGLGGDCFGVYRADQPRN